MVRKIISFISVVFIVFGGLYIIPLCSYAEDGETTSISDISEPETETELTSEAVTDPPELETTLSDINTTLKVLIFAVALVSGCLIAQGFSFWKW